MHRPPERNLDAGRHPQPGRSCEPDSPSWEHAGKTSLQGWPMITRPFNRGDSGNPTLGWATATSLMA